jgi:hypothetical protein
MFVSTDGFYHYSTSCNTLEYIEKKICHFEERSDVAISINIIPSADANPYYLTPCVPLSFKGEGERKKEGLRPS